MYRLPPVLRRLCSALNDGCAPLNRSRIIRVPALSNAAQNICASTCRGEIRTMDVEPEAMVPDSVLRRRSYKVTGLAALNV